MSYRDVVLADSPWALWRLDDLTDASGNGHTLTTAGSPSTGQASFVTGDTDSGAGSTTVAGSDYLATALPDTIAQTVELWIRPTGSLTVRIWGGYPSWAIGITGSPATAFVQGIDSGTGILSGSSSPITDGTVHHIVAAWSSWCDVSLYLDGVLVGTSAAVCRAHSSGGSLGGYGGGTWYVGGLQNAAVYNYELTSAQVVAHYNAGLGALLASALGSASGAGSTAPELIAATSALGSAAGGGTANGVLRSVWAASAKGGGAAGASAAAVDVPPLAASASASATSSGRGAATLTVGWPASSVGGAVTGAGIVDGELAHELAASALGSASAGVGTLAATLGPPVLVVRPLPLGVGSYNGIEWGPGTQIQIIDHKGLEELPAVRSADADRSDQNGQWAGPDYYGPRILTITFAILGRDNTDLRRLLAQIEQAWTADSVDRPTWLYNGQRYLTARVRKRAMTHYLGGRAATAKVQVEWYARDPLFYDAQQTYQLQAGAARIVPNSGDLAAPVRLQVVGPVANPAFGHIGQRRWLWVNATLISGEVLVADSDLRSLTINGVPSAQYLDPLSSWWSLARGDNKLRYDGAGIATLAYSAPRA